jgi:hypothetical protein
VALAAVAEHDLSCSGRGWPVLAQTGPQMGHRWTMNTNVASERDLWAQRTTMLDTCLEKSGRAVMKNTWQENKIG